MAYALPGSVLVKENHSIIDVARKAGVSIATVSRVLNRSAAVAPETVETVMKWVRTLGYELPPRKRRNSVNKNADTGRKQIAVIGIHSPTMAWLDVPVIGRAVRAVTRAARERGYGVALEDVVDLTHLDSVVASNDLAGAVVWLANYHRPDVLERLHRRLPIVRVMGDQIAPLVVDHVAPNNRHVGMLAFDYLQQQNCKSFVFVAMSPKFDLTRTRAGGFFQAAELAGASARSILISRDAPVDTFARWPASVCSNWPGVADQLVASSGEGPLGVFSSPDVETAMLYRALHERGAKIGKDIVIVSCDNDATALAGLTPRPASVDLLSEEVGRAAFAQLLLRIEHPNRPASQVLVTPRLQLPEQIAAALEDVDRDVTDLQPAVSVKKPR